MKKRTHCPVKSRAQETRKRLPITRKLDEYMENMGFKLVRCDLLTGGYGCTVNELQYTKGKINAFLTVNNAGQ